MSPESIDMIRAGGEQFAKVWTGILTTALREACTVTVARLDHVRLSDVVADLQAPVVLCTFATPPLDLPVLLVLPRRVALVCIDRMLGGGTVGDQPDRSLTAIDSSLLSHLAAGLLPTLPGCFLALGLSEAQLVSIEETTVEDPAELPVEDVLAVRVDLLLGATEAQAALCLPGVAVAKQLLGPAGRSRSTGPTRVDFRSQLGRALQPVTIEIAVEFRPAVIRPAQLFQLSVGDVLPLSHPTTAPLSITAAGTVVARAVPGAEGSNLAVLIVDPKSQEASAW